MQAMYPHRRNQFAIELAAQAMRIAGSGLMHPENGLELLEQQLDLPPKRIQGPDHGKWQPFLRHIGDQEGPVTQCQMPVTPGPTLSARVGLEPPAPGVGHLGADAQAHQATGACLIGALPHSHQSFRDRRRGVSQQRAEVNWQHRPYILQSHADEQPRHKKGPFGHDGVEGREFKIALVDEQEVLLVHQGGEVVRIAIIQHGTGRVSQKDEFALLVVIRRLELTIGR